MNNLIFEKNFAKQALKMVKRCHSVYLVLFHSNTMWNEMIPISLGWMFLLRRNQQMTVSYGKNLKTTPLKEKNVDPVSSPNHLCVSTWLAAICILEEFRTKLAFKNLSGRVKFFLFDNYCASIRTRKYELQKYSTIYHTQI